MFYFRALYRINCRIILAITFKNGQVKAIRNQTNGVGFEYWIENLREGSSELRRVSTHFLYLQIMRTHMRNRPFFMCIHADYIRICDRFRRHIRDRFRFVETLLKNYFSLNSLLDLELKE